MGVPVVPATSCVMFFPVDGRIVQCILEQGHDGDHRTSSCLGARFGKRIFFEVQWRVAVEKQGASDDA